MGYGAFDISTQQGAAVLGLLERAQVPPLPVFYQLFFDYVAGVRTLMGEQLGSAIEATSVTAAERLYADFVAPYESHEPIERAIAQMVERLNLLDALIVRSAQAASDHSRSLRIVSQQLMSESLNAKLIGDWILRLKITNDRVCRVHDELAAALLDARHEIIESQTEIGRLRRRTLLDPLTGVSNRAGIEETTTRALEEGAGEPLSIALLDIDHFKSLNDTYGHQLGDQVLRIVTSTLVRVTGADDRVGRMGGDEFVVLMPGIALEAATSLADRLRRAVAQSDLSGALGTAILGQMTASIGVAERVAGETLAELFERADRCLYRAKQSGRNRVEVLVDG